MKELQTELLRARARLVEQARLPHPRSGFDHQRSPISAPRGVEHGADAPDLVLALEQRDRPSHR